MIQIHLLVFGAVIVGTICYAAYTHFMTDEEQQRHTYGPRAGNYTLNQPPPSNSNKTKRIRTTRDKCTICFEPADLLFLECGHTFHRDCLNNWLKLESTCPNCRAHI